MGCSELLIGFDLCEGRREAVGALPVTEEGIVTPHRRRSIDPPGRETEAAQDKNRYDNRKLSTVSAHGLLLSNGTLLITAGRGCHALRSRTEPRNKDVHVPLFDSVLRLSRAGVNMPRTDFDPRAVVPGCRRRPACH